MAAEEEFEKLELEEEEDSFFSRFAWQCLHEVRKCILSSIEESFLLYQQQSISR
jgi:hypothetical protein